MDTNKMREEFEEGWGYTNEEQNIYFIPELNMYGSEGVSRAASSKSSAWIYFQRGWKSARSALVIELPKVVGFEGAYDSLSDHEFCPRMSDVEDADEVFSLCRTIEVREAIEAQGLKVKP